MAASRMFRRVGQIVIEVETQACIARIDYSLQTDYVYTVLFDKRLLEYFVIRSYDNAASWRLLEKLVNEGVSEEEAELLRIVQSLSLKMQPRYFERVAKGELTLEAALRAVKRRKETHMRYMAAKYFKEAGKRCRRVCTLGTDWANPTEVLFGKVGETQLVLFVDSKGVPTLSYVMTIRDSGDALCWVGWVPPGSRAYVTCAVFKCIVDGGDGCHEIDRLLREKLMEDDFSGLLEFMKNREVWIMVHDKELYDFIKSIATMNVMVGR
jgi:hypothetical protein